jgi:hypothetical protein
MRLDLAGQRHGLGAIDGHMHMVHAPDHFGVGTSIVKNQLVWRASNQSRGSL